MDDVELLRAVADGDRAALRELHRRHVGWLTLRLQRRCDDNGLVEETVQDTFVRAWTHARSFRGDGEVGAWLWGIAVRRLVDGLRRRRPAPVASELLEQHTGRVWAAEDEVLLGVAEGRLAAALADLSPELRDVLRACALDGLTHREAGVLLGLPTTTVRSRLRRARTILREGLT